MNKIPEKQQEVHKGYRGRTDGVALTTAMGVDRESFAETWRQLFRTAMAQPAAAFEAGMNMNRELLKIVSGNSTLSPDPKDGRFHHDAWHENPIYRRVGQAYLAWTQALDEWLDKSELSGMNRERARFVLDATKDVFAPMNSLPGNPEAMQRLWDSRGQSLVSGLRNLFDDQRNNYGYPAVADRKAFAIGKDVAASEGQVVFRNELFELIHYKPVTDQVDAEPLLYVFSQVNRFYLGDLTPDRSLFQHLLAAGQQVFAVSWRNPEREHRDWSLATYADGVIEAVRVIREMQNDTKVNLMGVCAGGLTTAVAAGVLVKQNKDWINSLSLFINVLDSRTEDSDFGLFVSERSVEAQKAQVRGKGYYDEKDVFEMFAWLRWEENIMSFLRRNYLLGEDPLAHPLLFWSMDYTRVPAGMHSDLLDMSLHNRLAKGELKVMGKRVNLEKCDYPIYLMAGSTDHITPWKACYRSTQLFGNKTTFVLTNQNHTQTICARTDNKHLRYWMNDALPADPDEWAAGATEHAGSWVHHWTQWLRDNNVGESQDGATLYTQTNYPPLDAAPGRYVLD